MIFYLRRSFAVVSWLAALGLFMLMVRPAYSGQAPGLALMFAVFALNGWLLWSTPTQRCARQGCLARSTPKPEAR